MYAVIKTIIYKYEDLLDVIYLIFKKKLNLTKTVTFSKVHGFHWLQLIATPNANSYVIFKSKLLLL